MSKRRASIDLSNLDDGEKFAALGGFLLQAQGIYKRRRLFGIPLTVTNNQQENNDDGYEMDIIKHRGDEVREMYINNMPQFGDHMSKLLEQVSKTPNLFETSGQFWAFVFWILGIEQDYRALTMGKNFNVPCFGCYKNDGATLFDSRLGLSFCQSKCQMTLYKKFNMFECNDK